MLILAVATLYEKRMKSFLEKHVKKLPNQSVQNLKKLYLLLVEQKVIIQFSTMY